MYLDYNNELRFHYGRLRFFISSNPVFHGGKFYCLDVDGRVAVFDPMDIEGSWGFCGVPYSKVPHLRAVFLGKEGQIWIRKLNLVTREWMKVESLGNEVIFE